MCALADALGPMIVGPGLEGLGGGVFPLCFGVVRDEFPKGQGADRHRAAQSHRGDRQHHRLPLGGVLTDGPGYHWIFVVAAIMGALATTTTVLFVPESPIRTPGASTSPARQSSAPP